MDMILLNQKDNVAVVLNDILKGDMLSECGIRLCAQEDIPYGHKIALRDIPKGEIIYKYGEPIARAVENIQKGQWVHVHNIESIRGLGR
ncbi:MAG TPA: UxaA family hydrolase [Candidatus Limivivens intestinipullorum]|uniref:UxaA family hydrolase n=1 Tax=Candidatus Limivivens intestinipullorum TaxID=2840858 RepID=A0A9D1ER46_9FIRM|nr:UxaA family hydrolase [Candidatus Limivivens intestinipullorum]